MSKQTRLQEINQPVRGTAVLAASYATGKLSLYTLAGFLSLQVSLFSIAVCNHKLSPARGFSKNSDYQNDCHGRRCHRACHCF